jgi:hypothetical protein
LRQEGVKTPKINNGKSLTSSSDLLYARNIASASRSFSPAYLVSRCLDTKALCSKKYILVAGKGQNPLTMKYILVAGKGQNPLTMKYILVAGKGQNPLTMKTTVIALAFLHWELIPHS